MSRRAMSSASWLPRSTRWPKIWPSFGARTSARSCAPRTRSKRRWRRCRMRSCCLTPTGRVQSMNRAAVSALASAGVHEPRRLQDLRLEGLDLSAVTRAIATGADTVSPGRLGPNHTRGTGRRRPAAAAACRARAGVDPATSEGPSCCLYDVTDLVRLDEMRSELVAVASHELQTPLTTLRMTLLMLQESVRCASRTTARARGDVADWRRTVDRDRSRIPGSHPHRSRRASAQSRARARLSGDCGSPPASRGTSKGAGRLADRSDRPRSSADIGRPAAPAGRLRQHPLERAQVHAKRREHLRGESSDGVW